MSDENTLPARAWLVVALLWVAGCLNYVDRVTLTTMRGSLMASIPMSDAQFGLLTSSFLWVYGLLSPFAGYFADRFSRSKVIVASLVAWTLVTWMTAYASSYGELLTTRILMGFSEACYLPAALALIADYHRGPTRSLATGLQMSGLMVGSGLGGVGGWLAERHGWQYAFAVFGSIGVVFGVVAALLLRDPPRLPEPRGDAMAGRPKEQPLPFGQAIASLFSRRSFLIALVFWGLLGIAGWGIVGWMPTYLRFRFHLSQGTAGMSATGYVQSAALAGVLIGGLWADRWRRTNERGRILVPFIGLCVASPAILLTAQTGFWPMAVAGLIAYGLSRSFTDSNMMPILCEFVDVRVRATGYGVLNLFSCLVGGLAIYAGGRLRDAGADVGHIFDLTALGLAICAALLYFVNPSPPSGAKGAG